MDFPTVKRLKKIRSSGEMPTIEEAAETNARAIEKVREYDSGSFLDVRKM
jgi:hypothetical protein